MTGPDADNGHCGESTGERIQRERLQAKAPAPADISEVVERLGELAQKAKREAARWGVGEGEDIKGRRAALALGELHRALGPDTVLLLLAHLSHQGAVASLKGAVAEVIDAGKPFAEQCRAWARNGDQLRLPPEKWSALSVALAELAKAKVSLDG